MSYTPPPIFITDKQKSVDDPTRIPVAFRQIERYIGNLRIPTGGGGGAVSISGPGETTTPGYLTQTGGFAINDTVAEGIAFSSNGGIIMTETSGSFTINESASSGTLTLEGGAVTVEAVGAGLTLQLSSLNGNATLGASTGIAIGTTTGDINVYPGTGHLILNSLPTTNPGGSGRVWNSGGVLHIT